MVGYAIAKTGGFSTYDLELETGGKIAAAAINAKGGVLGRQIKIIDCDTTSQLAQSGPLRAAADLEGRHRDHRHVRLRLRRRSQSRCCGRKACSRWASPVTRASATTASARPCSTSIRVRTPRAPLRPSSPTPRAGASRTSSPTRSTPIRRRSRRTSITRWKELSGGDVAGQDLFLNSDASIATQVSRLRAANPDVIVISSFPPGGASAIKQIRAAGIDTPIVTDEAFDGSSWIWPCRISATSFIPNLVSNGDGNDPSAGGQQVLQVDFKKLLGEEARCSLRTR